MTTEQRQRELTEAHDIYDRYVQPLEEKHRGEYVAVTPDGRTFLGASVSDVVDCLLETVGSGSGSHVFKVGPRIVGRWR